MSFMIHLRFCICTLFVFAVMPFGYASEGSSEEEIQVALRMIGHELLLATGDSTSRVLPISKEEDAYIIRFEKELSFNPDDLILATNTAIKRSRVSDGYVMMVRTCDAKDIVHSYKVGNLETDDLLPCKQRTLPEGCYELSITLLRQEQRLPPQAVKTEKKTGNASFLWVVFGGTVLLIVLIALRKKRPQPPNETEIVELGLFQLDTRRSILLFNGAEIELTGKEVALLDLLYQSVNTTVKREEILEKVWGDDGDYVGRTLDVFISKLRKKLEPDEAVKIMNIRGVGYKLVVG